MVPMFFPSEDIFALSVSIAPCVIMGSREAWR
jgi:hypothetical protein